MEIATLQNLNTYIAIQFPRFFPFYLQRSSFVCGNLTFWQVCN